MHLDLIFLVIAFVVLWIGAGISISGIDKISKIVKIPSFLVSFFALGFLTSISEISVAYFSLIDKTPGISVGNLVGGSAVLTLLIIPLLAVLNKGIKIDDRTGPISFPLAYLVISLPVILMLDKTIGRGDAMIMIFAFGFLAFTISARNTLLDKIENALMHPNVNVFKESTKIIIGVALIILSCKYIVDTTVFYANKLAISPFIVGLLLISLGTNLPELTVLIRSTLSKKKNIALGDYVGSAALNTCTLGFLALFNNAPINLGGGVKYNLFLLPIGAVLFLLFTKNKNLERKEGYVLLSLYTLFVVLEFLIR